MTEHAGAFEDWLRAGAPDPAGDIDTMQGAENAINRLIGLARIFHTLASKELDGLRSCLPETRVDEAQHDIDIFLSDLVTESCQTVVLAAEDAAPSREMSIIKYPDFEALTLAARTATPPTSKSKTLISQAAAIASLKGGE